MVLRIADAIPAFEQYTTARGLSAGTVRRHVLTVGQFGRACQKVKGSQPTMGQVDHQCVAEFFAGLNGGQGHRNNALESVRAFLTWAEKWGYLRPGFTAASLLDGYKSRVAERQPKYYFDAAEFPALLDAAGERNPVDRAIVALALYTLARVSEIQAIRLRHLDLAKREVHLYREKRDRWTVTGMTPELYAELETWLTVYARQTGYLSPWTMIREHPDWLVTPARQSWQGGYRLNPDKPVGNMERVAKRVMTDLGVTATRRGRSVEHLGEGMHTFRRSGARAFLKHLSENLGHQRALIRVGLMLDHKDLQNTMRYIGVEQEKDELNEWLKGESMYSVPDPPPAGSVIPFRRVV